MPAARLALRPEYRIFYDALTDYGDWVLIEPYGYVFRPRVDFVTWRPYSNGFWTASDPFGWVWVSAEPFGWATEHYGRWLYDDYQGWVWLPGRDWGPAWVAWQMSDDLVGWAPLSPVGMPSYPRLAGGEFVYTPVQSLASTNVSTQLLTRDKIGDRAQSLVRVENSAERAGVRVELGPPIDRIERAIGAPLTRTRLEDVLPPRGDHGAARGSGGASRDTSGLTPLASPQALKQAGEEAARDALRFNGHDVTPPARVPIVRAFGPAAERPARPVRRPAPADSGRAGRR
jgi:hypothetical protein